jgi:hypothetical protein
MQHSVQSTARAICCVSAFSVSARSRESPSSSSISAWECVSSARAFIVSSLGPVVPLYPPRPRERKGTIVYVRSGAAMWSLVPV